MYLICFVLYYCAQFNSLCLDGWSEVLKMELCCHLVFKMLKSCFTIWRASALTLICFFVNVIHPDLTGVQPRSLKMLLLNVTHGLWEMPGTIIACRWPHQWKDEIKTTGCTVTRFCWGMFVWWCMSINDIRCCVTLRPKHANQWSMFLSKKKNK